MLVSGKKAFQAEGPGSTKALRWDYPRHTPGRAVGRANIEGVQGDEITGLGHSRIRWNSVGHDKDFILHSR